jgi:hypothetical protein
MNPGRALSEQHGQRTQAPNDIEFGVGSRSLAAEYLFAHDECLAQAGKLGRGHVENAEKDVGYSAAGNAAKTKECPLSSRSRERWVR